MTQNFELQTALQSKGENDLAILARNILPRDLQCIFLRQAEQLGLGNAVLCAERAVAGDPFVVVLPDDFDGTC